MLRLSIPLLFGQSARQTVQALSRHEMSQPQFPTETGNGLSAACLGLRGIALLQQEQAEVEPPVGRLRVILTQRTS